MTYMKIGLRLFMPVALGVSLLQSASAQPQPMPMARTNMMPNMAAPKDDKSVFPDDKEKASYAIGMFFGNQIKRSNLEVDMQQLLDGLKTEVSGGTPKLSEQDAQGAIRAYQMANQAKMMEKNRQLA